MRIVLTVPEDIMREACQRIVVFCQEHIVTREKVKEIDSNILAVTSDSEVFCQDALPRVS